MTEVSNEDIVDEIRNIVGVVNGLLASSNHHADMLGKLMYVKEANDAGFNGLNQRLEYLEQQIPAHLGAIQELDRVLSETMTKLNELIDATGENSTGHLEVTADDELEDPAVEEWAASPDGSALA